MSKPTADIRVAATVCGDCFDLLNTWTALKNAVQLGVMSDFAWENHADKLKGGTDWLNV